MSPQSPNPLAGKRLNLFLSDKGLCSRREADRWIESGRVTLDGKIAKLGDRVTEGQTVCLDGIDITAEKSQKVILAYNKPVGVECTTDTTRPHNIVKAVNYKDRIFPIGRLDQMSEGLILLTNRGEIVNPILRSQFNHEKEYLVECESPLTGEVIRQLCTGVDIGDERGPTKPCKARKIGVKRLSLVLTEGRNRQIRRMLEAVGNRVVRLRRVRIMNIELGDLPSGTYRPLKAAEIKSVEAALKKSSQKTSD